MRKLLKKVEKEEQQVFKHLTRRKKERKAFTKKMHGTISLHQNKIGSSIKYSKVGLYWNFQFRREVGVRFHLIIVESVLAP